MRSDETEGEAAFAADLGRYRTYRATVGTPSEPVVSGGFLYVEVPVMIVGETMDGKPLATGGSVTMRRPLAGKGGWRIFTG